MPYAFNPFTGNLDFYRKGVTGPSVSTDRAIATYNGVTGQVIQDNPKAVVQAGGAVKSQGFITNSNVTDTVTVATDEVWIAPGLTIKPGGVVELAAGASIIII